MLDALPNLLKLERLIVEFRVEIGKSLGWWVATQPSRSELEQFFPINNMMVIAFLDDMFDILGPCTNRLNIFTNDQCPPWLMLEPGVEFKGFNNLIKCLSGIRQESLEPIQPALLQGIEQLLDWTLTELRSYTDRIIESVLMHEGNYA